VYLDKSASINLERRKYFLTANLPQALYIFSVDLLIQHFQEHQVYVEAVAALCDDRIVWRDDGVPLIRSQGNPNEYM
jgi:hypothetical protein